MQKLHYTRWAITLITLLTLFSTSLTGFSQSLSIKTSILSVVDDQFPIVDAFVSVINNQGMPIPKLTGKDFNLTEDNKVITSFDLEAANKNDQSLTVVLAIDTSAAMAGAGLKNTLEAARELVKGFGPKEQLGIVTFGAQAQVLLDITGDKADIDRKLSGLAANGYPALYDGVVKGIELLKKRSERRVLIVITNGTDYRSQNYKLADALNEAKNGAVPIMAAGFGPNVDKNSLEMLTTLTGTVPAVITPDSSTLKDTLHSLFDTMRAHYRIRYTSTLPADSAAHELSLTAIFQTATDTAKTSFNARSKDIKITVPGYTPNQETGGLLKFSPQAVVTGAALVKMELLVDNQPVDSSLAAPFEIHWDSSKVSAGVHELTFKATDSASNTGLAKLNLKIRPPVILSLPAPQAGDSLSGTVTFTPKIDTLAKIARVEAFMDGQSLQSLTAEPYDFSWDTRKFAGQHTLVVTATDINGFAASTPKIQVQVQVQGGDGILFIIALVVLAALLLIIPLTLRQRRQKRAPAGPAPAFTPASEQTAPPPPAGQAQAVLVQTDPAAPGTIWPLSGAEVRLGRKRDENDVILSSAQASRRHAIIRCSAGQYILYSLNPENPTRVNGTVIHQQVLATGDELQLGEQIFRFEIRG